MTRKPPPAHVRLANEISAQFRHRDPDMAVQEIAEHIQAFWEPRMRTALTADAVCAADGLDPLAVAAAALLTDPGREGSGTH